MRKLPPAVLLSAALALALAPKSIIHAHLFTAPGKQFLLGGGQATGFRVAGRSAGPVPVEVLARPWRVALAFADSSAAVIVNASARRAVLDLDITTPASLGMTYEPAAHK